LHTCIMSQPVLPEVPEDAVPSTPPVRKLPTTPPSTPHKKGTAASTATPVARKVRLINGRQIFSATSLAYSSS